MKNTSDTSTQKLRQLPQPQNRLTIKKINNYVKHQWRALTILSLFTIAFPLLFGRVFMNLSLMRRQHTHIQRSLTHPHIHAYACVYAHAFMHAHTRSCVRRHTGFSLLLIFRFTLNPLFRNIRVPKHPAPIGDN